ncbi:hypothetical protein ACIGXM_22835 [Kitasatospora sp. NPDC052896]|uniref:hypothetical protein n=1 Tax=Kitasatospora sp. NPDC052896 TaxID=3364061 RepID=UPI0037C9D0AA
MTQLDETRLGPVVVRLRGTPGLGGHLAYIAAFALVAGVVGISTGEVLDGLYGLAVGTLAGSPVVLGWRQEVTIHQDAFVWRRLTGTRTIARTEIRSLRRIRFSSFPRGNYEVLAVTLLNGHQLSIGWIQDPARLARLLSGAEPAPMSAWQPPEPTGRGHR